MLLPPPAAFACFQGNGLIQVGPAKTGISVWTLAVLHVTGYSGKIVCVFFKNLQHFATCLYEGQPRGVAVTYTRIALKMSLSDM